MEAWRSRKLEVLSQFEQIAELRGYGLSVSAIHRMLTAKGDINMPLRSFSHNVSKLDFDSQAEKEAPPPKAIPQKNGRAGPRAGGKEETGREKLDRWKRIKERTSAPTFDIPDAFSEEYGKDVEP